MHKNTLEIVKIEKELERNRLVDFIKSISGLLTSVLSCNMYVLDAMINDSLIFTVLNYMVARESV